MWHGCCCVCHAWVHVGFCLDWSVVLFFPFWTTEQPNLFFPWRFGAIHFSNEEKERWNLVCGCVRRTMFDDEQPRLWRVLVAFCWERWPRRTTFLSDKGDCLKPETHTPFKIFSTNGVYAYPSGNSVCRRSVCQRTDLLRQQQ